MLQKLSDKVSFSEKQRRILSNFSYLSVLEIFILIAPLITYPYLVKVLGRELYGWAITAQVTASYCTVLIDFGFKRISARHIATNTHNKEKIGEVVSAILILRLFLWIISFLLYITIVCYINSYREHFILFLFSFFTTLSSVFFLDFYFQGIEQMKYITIVNIIVRGIFVAATFVFITSAEQYIYVPLLWSIGYALGGGISLWIAFHKHRINFRMPNRTTLKEHIKEGSVVFTSEAMLTVKDKFNYNLMGALIGMSDIVVYDIGSKISGLLLKPITIITTVLFPQMAQSLSVKTVKKAGLLILLISCTLVLITNVFLPQIVKFFIKEDIDLFAIRLYTISPLILGISSFIAVNVFFALGKTKVVLGSTFITTIGYLILLATMYFWGLLNSVLSFVILTVSALLLEAIYRIAYCIKLLKSEENGIK